jgi:hypothetical protein
MGNKHGAGCTCCGEFDCGPCDPVIDSITLTYSGETIAIPISQQLSELSGCVLLKRVCLGVDVVPLVDYSADVEYDARLNDAWRRDSGNYLCCDPTYFVGGGGGGGPGPGPVTPDNCIPCASYYVPPDAPVGAVNCIEYLTNYGITAQVIKNVSYQVNIHLLKTLLVELHFEDAGGGDVRVYGGFSLTIAAVPCYRLTYDWEWYYNDACDRYESCVTGFSSQLCSRNSVPNGLFNSYFDCSLDTPNWVLGSDGTACFTNEAEIDLLWNADCCQEFAACSEAENDTNIYFEKWLSSAPSKPYLAALGVGIGTPAICLTNPGWDGFNTSACDCEGGEASIPIFNICTSNIAYDFTVDCDNLCKSHAYSTTSASGGCESWVVSITECLNACDIPLSIPDPEDVPGPNQPFVDPDSPCYSYSNLCTDTNTESVTIDLSSYRLPTAGGDLEIVCAGGP